MTILGKGIIFKTIFKDKTVGYSISVGNRDLETKEYDNAYIQVRFTGKAVETEVEKKLKDGINNVTINDSFLTFYRNKDNNSIINFVLYVKDLDILAN